MRKILIFLIAFILTSPILYEIFLFYPPMEYDSFFQIYSIDNFLKLPFILLNQRIILETSPPDIPKELPIYQIKDSNRGMDHVLDFEFVKSSNFKLIGFAKTISFDEAIQKLRKGEFITEYGKPMSPLGEVVIYMVELKSNIPK